MSATSIMLYCCCFVCCEQMNPAMDLHPHWVCAPFFLSPHKHIQDSSTADPRKRMRRFFDTLYSSLTKGARAVLQVYPENAQQVHNTQDLIFAPALVNGLTAHTFQPTLQTHPHYSPHCIHRQSC